MRNFVQVVLYTAAVLNFFASMFGTKDTNRRILFILYAIFYILLAIIGFLIAINQNQTK